MEDVPAALADILPMLPCISSLVEKLPLGEWPLPVDTRKDAADLVELLDYVTSVWQHARSSKCSAETQTETVTSLLAADIAEDLPRGSRAHWLGPLQKQFAGKSDRIPAVLNAFVKQHSEEIQNRTVAALTQDTKYVFAQGVLANLREGFLLLSTNCKSAINRQVRMATAAMVCGSNFAENDISAWKVGQYLGLRSNVVEAGLIGRQNLIRGAALSNTEREKLKLLDNVCESPRQLTTRLSDSVRELARKFWLSSENTRVSPCKKDVILARDVSGAVEVPRRMVSKHWLEVSQLTLFRRFQLANPHLKIGVRSFERCKPHNVVRIRRRDNISCCCRYHEDMRMVLGGFHKAREALHSGCLCLNAACCPRVTWKAGSKRMRIEGTELTCGIIEVGTSTSTFAESLLCPRPGDTHRIECLLGTCADCGGLSNLKLCESELSSDLLFPWSCYETVDIGRVNEEGKPIRRLQFVQRSTTMLHLVHKLQILLLGHAPGKSNNCRCKGTFVVNTAPANQPQTLEVRDFNGVGGCPFLRPYAYHTFMALHQHRQYRRCIEELPLGHCCLVFDFSENHKLNIPRAAQSMHWVVKQATILVCVLWRHAELSVDGIESTLEKPTIIKDYLYWISDDGHHDHHFIAYMRKTVIEDYFLGRGLKKPVFLHEWADGCAAQNKCAPGFHDVATSKAEWHLGVPCQRNFFETAHAKGEQDAAGAHVKHAAATAVISEADKWYAKILDAKDLYNFCLDRLTRRADCSFAKARASFNARFFYFVPEDPLHEEEGGLRAVDRSATPSFRSVDGTQRMHSVRAGVGEGQLLFRDRTCYCTHCYAQCALPIPSSEGCLESLRVDAWRDVVLRLEGGEQGNPAQLLVDTYGLGLSLEVRRGSTFAVRRAPGDNAHLYYLVKALSTSKQVGWEGATDDYGVVHGSEAWVISGRYYEWKDELERDGYTLDTTRKCLVPSEAVVCSDVCLIRRGGAYHISDREHQRLLALV